MHKNNKGKFYNISEDTDMIYKIGLNLDTIFNLHSKVAILLKSCNGIEFLKNLLSHFFNLIFVTKNGNISDINVIDYVISPCKNIRNKLEVSRSMSMVFSPM